MGWTPPRNVLEAAERKRHQLKGIARSLAERAGEILREHVELAEKLVRSLPAAGKGSLPHAAEDGGSGLLEFEQFTFYGVQAWAAGFKPGSGGLGTVAEVMAADVGIVVPSGSEEVRVRFYRETLEAWAAREVVERLPGGSLVLWDGGLTPLIAGRKPWAETPYRMRELARRAAEALGAGEDRLHELVAERHDQRPIAVQDLVVESGALTFGGGDHLWVSYLEYLEKLEAVKRLLRAAIERGSLVVFVTKTSRSKSLIQGVMPDVYYLARAREYDPFYTTPRLRLCAIDMPSRENSGGRFEWRVPCTGEAERLVPEPYSSFFSGEVAVVDMYARLRPGGSILRLEAVFPAGEAEGWARDTLEDRAREVLERIMSIPQRDGYPYTLLLAHRRAHLPRESLARAASILGYGTQRSGRAMLS